ncbi:MAG: HPr family phosphocarrier protein [Synergistaceae bacterium]|jgi:phosphotransferase system HPr (HPr) family protein|nr:HPr family phosphocarrier protein [Synergistaceae bacterium]
MISKEYTILAPEGLHARPAKEFLNLVRQFKSKVVLIKDGITADAGSMLGILSMQATYNSKIILEVSGEDEVHAAERFDCFFDKEIINL